MAEALAPEVVAQILYQAGFRGDELWQFVAIAGRESGYQPAAHRSDLPKHKLSGDRGLWQINAIWDKQLIDAGIIKQKSDLFDPVTNAKAARYVLQKQGMAAWNMSRGGWSTATDTDAAKAAVKKAADQGLLGGDYDMPASNAPTSLPSDAKLVKMGNSTYAVFQLGAGAWIYYGVPAGTDLSGRKVTTLSTADFWKAFRGAVNGGNAAELNDIQSSFGTYRAFWDSIVNQVLGPQNPALRDPGVLKVLAQYAARPDMSEVELQNLLKATDYWKSKTESELEWNSLAPAEQEKRRQNMVAQMQQTYFQFVGKQLDAKWVDKATLENLASGKMTISQWTEQVVKPKAAANAESPWSRTTRSETEDQRKRGVDIENTIAQIRSQLNQWGLKWSDQALSTWATAIVEKRKSDDDLMNSIRAQAKQQYGRFKTDDNVDTQTAASPWLETYNRTMEEQATLFTPEVAKALQNGQTVWDFEKSLKKSEKWRGTKNGREELFTLAQQLGSMTGHA